MTAVSHLAFGFGGTAPPLSRRIFDKYDKDHSGTISNEEFREMVYELGYHLSDEEFTLAMKMLDKDGSGEIDYPEFAAWWSTDDRFKKLQLSEEKLVVLQACSDFFQAFDEDGNGVLDRSEFTKCHETLVACEVTTDPFEKFLANIDTDGDGHVSFNEYVTWLVSHGLLEKAATAQKVQTPDAPASTQTDATATTTETPAGAASPAAATQPQAVSAVDAFRLKSSEIALQASKAAEELRARRLARLANKAA